MTAISAILYYIAFVPPRWLRHAWHFEDLRDFLNGSTLPASDHISTVEIYRHLGVAARHTVTSMVDAVPERFAGGGCLSGAPRPGGCACCACGSGCRLCGACRSCAAAWARAAA